MSKHTLVTDQTGGREYVPKRPHEVGDDDEIETCKRIQSGPGPASA